MITSMRSWKAVVLAGIAAVVGAVALTTPAHADTPPQPADTYQYPNYAPTPPMGWNDWSYYQCNYDEQTILDNARALVSTGLAAKGYQYVTIDDCWMQRTRDADGNLQVNKDKFPDGMAYVADQIHKLGLKFGIYEDAGTHTCGGYAGSEGHYTADANLFASWGVDYVKLDGCYVSPGTAENYKRLYTAWSKAMLATGRPMVFSVSAPAYFQYSGDTTWHSVIKWSSQVGNLWREGADIALSQFSGSAKWNSIMFNYHYNVGLADFSSPGRWNDPDFLLAGDSGLSTDQITSQMALWAMMAAPLNSSTDLTHLSPAALKVLGNSDLIAVDQDPLGIQGRIVQQGKGYDVLSKPLAGGDRAVAIFNSSDQAQTITTSAATAGMPAADGYRLTNLITKGATQTNGTISANVRPHATVVYRVHAGGAHAFDLLAPSTAVTIDDLGSVSGSTIYRVSLTDNGERGAADTVVTLQAPDGWQVAPASARLNRVAPGTTASATFSVTPQFSQQPGTHTATLTAVATYQAGPAGEQTVTGSETVTTVVPYPDLASAFNNVGITDNADTAPGNFDGTGDSFSAQELAAVGATPGATISYQGTDFTWPDVPAGTPDNVAAAGQMINLAGSGGALAFLGSASGFQSGAVTVTYTDGSTSTATLGFPNWTTADPTAYGAVPVLTMQGRNTPSGPANFNYTYHVYYNSIPLTAGKTVASVTLPEVSVMHIFAMTVTD